jgi:hypothetical protein
MNSNAPVSTQAQLDTDAQAEAASWMQASAPRTIAECIDAKPVSRERLAAIPEARRWRHLRLAGVLAFVRRARRVPRSDVLPAIMRLVEALSDNRQGACTMSAEKLGRALGRHEARIRDAIKRGEAEGVLGVERRSGGTFRLWLPAPGDLSAVRPMQLLDVAEDEVQSAGRAAVRRADTSLFEQRGGRCSSSDDSSPSGSIDDDDDARAREDLVDCSTKEEGSDPANALSASRERDGSAPGDRHPMDALDDPALHDRVLGNLYGQPGLLQKVDGHLGTGVTREAMVAALTDAAIALRDCRKDAHGERLRYFLRGVDLAVPKFTRTPRPARPSSRRARRVALSVAAPEAGAPVDSGAQIVAEPAAPEMDAATVKDVVDRFVAFQRARGSTWVNQVQYYDSLLPAALKWDAAQGGGQKTG